MFPSIMFSKKEFQFLFGFTPKFIHGFVLFTLVFLDSFFQETNPEILINALWLIPLAIAAAGAAAVANDAVKTKKNRKIAEDAAKKVGKETEAEKLIAAEASSMLTGVDPSSIERGIARGATPIGAAIEAQQRDVQQELLAAGGGGGVPGAAFDARAQALQQQLAQTGTEAIADIATQETGMAEEAARQREQQRLALLGMSADLARTRKGQQAQAALGGVDTSSGAIQQMGTAAVSSMADAGASKAFA